MGNNRQIFLYLRDIFHNLLYSNELMRRILYIKKTKTTPPLIKRGAKMETTQRMSREQKADHILNCGRPIFRIEDGFLVPSESDEDRFYLVSKRNNGRITCSCKDFTDRITEEKNGHGNGSINNGNIMYCKHIRALFKAVRIGSIVIEKSPTSAILEYPFRANQILQRQGLDYVEGATVIQRCNDAFNYNGWSFTILEVKQIEDEIIVRGRMTVHCGEREVVKEQFGGHVLVKNKQTGEMLSRCDAMKSAATDALKKCASLYGIGIALYSENDRHLSFQSA